MNTTQIRELLQKRKLKVTPTRLNLLSEMDKYGSAMSHSTIQNQLNPIDRVTLYRTLEILKDKSNSNSEEGGSFFNNFDEDKFEKSFLNSSIGNLAKELSEDIN